MPILKQAKKALTSSANRREANDKRRRTMKEQVKKVERLITAKDDKGAREALPGAYKAIDKAAKAGVIKKNTASRKKSRLSRTIDKIAA